MEWIKMSDRLPPDNTLIYVSYHNWDEIEVVYTDICPPKEEYEYWRKYAYCWLPYELKESD